MPKSENLRPAPKWEKGQSGNPHGRKKGSKNITTYIKMLLDKKTPTPDGLMATASVIAHRMIQAAVKGDRHMIKEILDRTEGRPFLSLDQESGVGQENHGLVVFGDDNEY